MLVFVKNAILMKENIQFLAVFGLCLVGIQRYDLQAFSGLVLTTDIFKYSS